MHANRIGLWPVHSRRLLRVHRNKHSEHPPGEQANADEGH